MALPLQSPGSHALLIGCGEYESSTLHDIESVAQTIHDLAQILVDSCGMDPSQVRVLLNPASSAQVGFAIAELSEIATDTLLFYYVGHGAISSTGELYLTDAATDVRPTHLSYSALRYRNARESILNSAARTSLVVLDCCWSGRAIESLTSGETSNVAADLARVEGGCVLTASARDELALAPTGSKYTAFSGELIAYLRDGDPAGPPALTVADVYRHLAFSLPAKGHPTPQRSVSGDADRLILAENALFVLQRIAVDAKSHSSARHRERHRESESYRVYTTNAPIASEPTVSPSVS